MRIGKLYNDPEAGSGGLQKGTTISLDDPYEQEGRTVYRKVYYLRFRIDPSADGVVLHKEASAFNGQFNPYTLNLTPGNEVFQARDWESVTEEGQSSPNLVKVHLNHPWRLRYVRTNDYRGVEVLRLDGEAVSEEPSLRGNSNTYFTDEFIAKDFALRKVAPFPVTAAEVQVGSKELEAHTLVGKKGLAGGSTTTYSLEKEKNGAATDEPFLTPSLEEAAAPPHGITHIKLKGVPTGPRLLLGEIDQEIEGSTLISVWQQAGEALDTPLEFLSSSAEIEALINSLQTAFDRYFEQVHDEGLALPNQLHLPLVIESDAPATFKFHELALEYSLVRKRFENTSEKTTLKFTGRSVETQSLGISLPDDIAIHRASVQLTPKFKSQGKGEDQASLLQPLEHHQGLHMSAGKAVLQQFQPDLPKRVNEVSVALLPLSQNLNFSLEIIADRKGQPSGEQLTKSEAVTMTADTVGHGAAAERRWHRVDLIKPVTLDAVDYWLKLVLHEGQLIWLSESTTCKVLVQDLGGENGAIQLTAFKPLSQFTLSIPRATPTDGLSVRIAALSADPKPESEAPRNEYDLTAALAAALAEGGQNIQLDFQSVNSGSVTVYPPAIEYDLQSEL